jgi:hypothetical protein
MPIREVLSIVVCCVLTLPSLAQNAPTANTYDQLVAPIALYPDALVAQVLAASTYPPQVVEADKWLQQNSSLQGDALISAVDQQSWDPSIKALTQFPSVLNNMSKNLSWVSALGDAYVNAPQDVMSAIQVMRKHAQDAGNLKSTPEQTISTQNETIVIEPAQPEVVYVPEYSSDIYGVPIAPYPGYYWAPGAALLSFGVGTAVGAAISGGWGWNSWGANWRGGNVVYNRNTYVSRSNTFVNRNANLNQINRANVNQGALNRNAPNNARNQGVRSFNNQNLGGGQNRGGGANLPSGARQKSVQAFSPSAGQIQAPVRDHQSQAASRGFGSADRASTGAASGAFGGFNQGGSARMQSARGSSSFGGGGGFRGGGGGFRGGGRR